jgi:hypothetical protein
MPLSPPQKLLLLDTWQRGGLPARDFVFYLQVPDLAGQLLLGGAGDQQKQAMAPGLLNSLSRHEMTSFLHPGVQAATGGNRQPMTRQRAMRSRERLKATRHQTSRLLK